MEDELTQKEFFDKVATNIVEGKAGDYLAIKEQMSKALLYNAEQSGIVRGFIIITKGEECMEWEIDEYKVKKCPKNLYVAVKNPKVLAVCIGDVENEDSYFVIRIKKNEPPQDISVFAAIEIEECAVVFYFDGKNKDSQYIIRPSFGANGTDVFSVVKFLKDLEVQMHGQEKVCGGGLESRESVLFGGLERGESLEKPIWK